MSTTTQEDAARLHRVRLVIDETTAHITAPAGPADGLFAWFQTYGIPCQLRRGGGICGLDLIDFGDPAPAEERQIRAVYAAWRSRSRG